MCLFDTVFLQSANEFLALIKSLRSSGISVLRWQCVNRRWLWTACCDACSMRAAWSWQVSLILLGLWLDWCSTWHWHCHWWCNRGIAEQRSMSPGCTLQNFTVHPSFHQFNTSSTVMQPKLSTQANMCCFSQLLNLFSQFCLDSLHQQSPQTPCNVLR